MKFKVTTQTKATLIRTYLVEADNEDEVEYSLDDSPPDTAETKLSDIEYVTSIEEVEE